MIDSPDFKRKSGMPSEFERRRIQRLLEEFIQERAQFLYDGPGELRFRQQGWTVELYQAQPHPVHKNRAVRLPVALLQAEPGAQYWRLFFRGQHGHWQPYPDVDGGAAGVGVAEPVHNDSTVDQPLAMRLTEALDTIAQDSLGVFW